MFKTLALSAAVLSGCLLVGLVVWVSYKFYLFVQAKRSATPFTVELHDRATYIRKKSGELRKIADHPYTQVEMDNLRRMAIVAKNQVEKEKAHERN